MIEKAKIVQWILRDEYLKRSGISAGVWNGWTHRHLKRGVHFQIIGHQTLVHVRNLEEWIRTYKSTTKPKYFKEEINEKKPPKYDQVCTPARIRISEQEKL